MTDNPCQKELDEFRKATAEWAEAHEAAKAFEILEPLSSEMDVEPKPAEYYDRMSRAFEKDEIARKNYFLKARAFLECQQKHKK